MEIKPLAISSYLSLSQIDSLLENVEYIIKAVPPVMTSPELPIHFTIFLNTSDPIPEEIRPMILEKFYDMYKITEARYVLSDLQRVAFALTSQDTPMPRHLIDDAEASTIPWKLLHIIDFLGDAKGFEEVKDGLSGWSYSYN